MLRSLCCTLSGRRSSPPPPPNHTPEVPISTQHRKTSSAVVSCVQSPPSEPLMGIWWATCLCWVLRFWILGGSRYWEQRRRELCITCTHTTYRMYTKKIRMYTVRLLLCHIVEVKVKPERWLQVWKLNFMQSCSAFLQQNSFAWLYCSFMPPCSSNKCFSSCDFSPVTECKTKLSLIQAKLTWDYGFVFMTASIH